MMEQIQHYLYLLSNALLLPTLLLILLLTAWTMLLLGGLVREWLTRRAVQRSLKQARHFLKAPQSPVTSETVLRVLRDCPNGLPKRFVTLLGQENGDLREYEKCLDDLECDVAASLAKLSWLTRVAPMLGLMGTLIPLGPALTGLASGDVAMLSGNLVVAFTATVIGVLIGCSSFTIGLVRKNWYQRDMGELEYILARVNPNPSSADAAQKEKVG
jgi:biopolymer transport protein ExbB/TolQ